MREQPELPTDAELVARLRARDEAAFALVLDAWSGGMVRVARSIVSTHASADEVVQDAWLAVIQGIGGVRGPVVAQDLGVPDPGEHREAAGDAGGPSRAVEPGAGEDDGPTVDPARFGGPGDRFPGHWLAFPAPWPSPEQDTLAGEVHERRGGRADRAARPAAGRHHAA